MTDENDDGQRTGQQKQCVVTGRKQGLIGKYDIWMCRQAFRERARDMGFEKYD
ncbi:MAG: 30S ribosomal protein S14 [Halalkalicoccus sp.]